MPLNSVKQVNIWNVGFILTSGLSLILSILLFTSVADSRLSWCILMGIALALELGKIVTINDRKRIIASLLIGVSVLGSAGGLNRALTLADDSLSLHSGQRATLQAQVDQTRRMMAQNNDTISQNNQAIERYIELDRIRSDARPLQAENRELQQEQGHLQGHLANLQASMNSLAPADVPELTAVLALLATLLVLPLSWVQAAVILLLACLLDALTVSFIRDGALERLTIEDSSPDPETKQPIPEEKDEILKETPADVNISESANVTAMDNSYPAFKRMMLARRDSGKGILSQRACIRELKLKDRQVRGFFSRLQKEGVIAPGRRSSCRSARSGIGC